MNAEPEILQALRAAATDGPRLVLSGPRMDPKLYQRVNEVLEAVGGRWSRTAEAHLFPMGAAEAIAPVLAGGQVVTLREKRNQAQYFPTPPAVVNRLLEIAAINPGMEVLEPSAGSGAIAAAVADLGAVVDCFEQDPGYAGLLDGISTIRTVRVADFLTVPATPGYDRVVMNPPFTRQADVAHVRHALGFLGPEGLLVAVMSGAVAYQNGPAAEFRKLVEERGGQAEMLPERAFAASGTGVRTMVVTVPATRPAGASPTVWSIREAEQSDEPEFADPAQIARQIVADLRKATRAFEAVAKALEQATSKPAEAVSEPGVQLGFDEVA